MAVVSGTGVPADVEVIASIVEQEARYVPRVVVDFVRIEDKGRRYCRWDAVRAKRTRVPGPMMGVGFDLPHDLAQYVVEAATAYPNGFWGLVAKGATFKSTGRRRTKP